MRSFSFVVYHKPNSVSAKRMIIIYLGYVLPHTSSGTPLDKLGARPCTQVRILPFHFFVTKDITPYRVPSLSASASLLAPLGLPGRALPATLLQHKRVGVFGLSSVLQQRLSSTQKNHTTIFTIIQLFDNHKALPYLQPTTHFVLKGRQEPRVQTEREQAEKMFAGKSQDAPHARYAQLFYAHSAR